MAVNEDLLIRVPQVMHISQLLQEKTQSRGAHSANQLEELSLGRKPCV